MLLPANFVEVLKCGQYVFYKYLKILVTENKPDH